MLNVTHQMKNGHGGSMLSLNGKHGVVISRIPVCKTGWGVMARHFPEFELTYCRSLQELTLLQLRRADVIIADISGEYGTLGARLKSITVY
jgi:hypothetical protein